MTEEMQIERKKKFATTLIRLNEFSVEEILSLLDLPFSKQTAYNWLHKEKKEEHENI